MKQGPQRLLPPRARRSLKPGGSCVTPEGSRPEPESTMKRIARVLLRMLSLAALLMLPLVPARTQAHVSVQIQLGVPLPPSPTLVVIQPGVQVVAGYPEEVFLQGGYYWLRRDGGWYRSSRPDAPFVVVESHNVPPTLLKLPPGQYKNYGKQQTKTDQKASKNQQKAEKHDGKQGKDH